MEVVGYRRVTEVDRACLVRLLEQSYRPLREINWGSTDWWDTLDQYVERLYLHPQSMQSSWIIDLSDHEIGFGHYDSDLEAGYLRQYCILPEARGKGYGRKLVAFLVNRLRDEGVSRILAITYNHPFFAPACRLVESQGFDVIDRTPEFDVDKLLYQIELPEIGG